jgi:integrase
MGAILKRERKDGTTGYTAVVRVKKAGVVIHSETRTFDRESAANLWIKKREVQLMEPGALVKTKDPTLAEVIAQYSLEKRKAHGTTKTQVLKTIGESKFAHKRCSEITSPDIVEYVNTLDCQPQTRGNYTAHLASVFTVAKPLWGYPLDKRAMEDARVVMEKMGVTGRSNERSRRPTLDELERLLTWFDVGVRKRTDQIPMGRIILFAIFSTRRQEEITRITFSDLDRDNLELIVRDMKNPGQKIGNDVRTALTPEALLLIDSQPKGVGRIWGSNPSSISASFTRACKILGIEDLTFHDMRHEGISRLFEMGWTIPQAATVSGHRSWQSLKRYSHIRQTGDKYAGWPWLARTINGLPAGQP